VVLAPIRHGDKHASNQRAKETSFFEIHAGLHLERMLSMGTEALLIAMFLDSRLGQVAVKSASEKVPLHKGPPSPS